MARPRVVDVKDFILEEREPPSREEFDFVEKWEPQQAESKEVEQDKPPAGGNKPAPMTPAPSFLSRLKSMLGLR